jgi:hypothetical protein
MFKKSTLFFSLVFCTAILNGCVLLAPVAIGVGIGVGTAKWLSDKLVEQVPHPYAQTVRGAREGIKDLKINIVKETLTDNLTQFSCKYPDGKTVWIDVAYVSASISRIEVRVGVWGGQPEARKILDGILAHLSV